MALFLNTPLAEYAKKLVALRGQENRIFKLALDNKVIEDLIIDLNTEKQMGQQHVDSLGRDLFNTITQRTTYAFSDPLGRGGSPYEVFRTGKYWFSFNVDVEQGVINISSNPQKENVNLFEVYTPELEGLTKENLQILIDEALKQFIAWYRKNLIPR